MIIIKNRLIITPLLISLNCVLCDEFYYQLSSMSSDQHKETPRLEDFFWTGSGDGPPAPTELPSPTAVQSVIVRTTTLLATVYLDSYPHNSSPDLEDCNDNCPDTTIPSRLDPQIPEDRRYWLLTVIQGSMPDNLQIKLARLYQKAFLRQQEKHLGIIKSLEPTKPKQDIHKKDKDKTKRTTNKDTTMYSFNNSTIINSTIRNHSLYNDTIMEQEPKEAKELLENTTEFYLANVEFFDVNQEETIQNTWIYVEPVKAKREADLLDLSDVEMNETIVFKREIIKPDQQPPVHVYVQNVTEFTESNSVEIIYIVLVGGRAVPATVAAKDMRLVRDAEVASELGAVVTTKAEPYLKPAEGLSGEEPSAIQNKELVALAVGSVIGLLLLLLIILITCKLIRKKKLSDHSARIYRDEFIRHLERDRLKPVHHEKDGKLISVVSPSRTRPCSTILPIYRTSSISSSSTSSSGITEVVANYRKRQKKSALKISHKSRVGTTDSLLQEANLSSDSSKGSQPETPTSYLSMPSVKSFPRSNVVEPLSRVLEPISVRHLDLESSSDSQEKVVQPRRQMSSQLVRLGSLNKDPGVIGPIVWDLHLKNMQDVKIATPPVPNKDQGMSRMRQKFNELVEDASSLFGTPGSSPRLGGDRRQKIDKPPQAKNENVRLPSSAQTSSDINRGKSAGIRIPETSERSIRPRTSLPSSSAQMKRAPPVLAWDKPSTSRLLPVVNPCFILAEGTLPKEDPAVPLISAIKSEIQRVRDNASNSK